MNSLQMDAFDTFHNGWALLTAGTEDSFNTMTVSWGGVGCLWNRSVATVYVRPSRHTYGFMEREELFTVSFYSGEYRPALALLGKLSGRNTDKVAMSGLTPVAMDGSVTFAQAKTTLLCRKLYHQDMIPENIPGDIWNRFYQEGEIPHRMYIGEVIAVKSTD